MNEDDFSFDDDASFLALNPEVAFRREQQADPRDERKVYAVPDVRGELI